MGATLAIALAAGAGLWYSQNYAYYKEFNGLSEITAYGDTFPVSNYRSIDADTSPLKLRACFTVDWDYYDSSDYRDIAEPLQAPGWFSCFDAKSIAQDIQNGDAIAILAEENHPFGFSRYIAQYPDGRAFMWRQINECGSAQFEGKDLPANCIKTPTPAPSTALEQPLVEPTPVPAPDVEIATPVPPKAVKEPGLATGGIRPITALIKLTPIGGGAPEEILQENTTAVSDNAQPGSLWACFTTPLSFGLLSETYEVIDAISPTNPISEFPCFNASQISKDVANGTAMALLGTFDVWPGVDRIVAVYPDGRAMAWHQKRTN